MGALGEVKMTRIRKRLPSPAMIVAIIALMASTAGTTWAFGLNALSNKAKEDGRRRQAHLHDDDRQR